MLERFNWCSFNRFKCVAASCPSVNFCAPSGFCARAQCLAMLQLMLLEFSTDATHISKSTLNDIVVTRVLISICPMCSTSWTHGIQFIQSICNLPDVSNSYAVYSTDSIHRFHYAVYSSCIRVILVIFIYFYIQPIFHPYSLTASPYHHQLFGFLAPALSFWTPPKQTCHTGPKEFSPRRAFLL